jgi:hypothetical protein
MIYFVMAYSKWLSALRRRAYFPLISPRSVRSGIFMAISAIFRPAETANGEPMSVVPFKRATNNETPKRAGFWHRFAVTIDALAAYPVQHALSAQDLQRVDDEIARCRQLMFAPRRPLRIAFSRRTPVRSAFAPVKVRS